MIGPLADAGDDVAELWLARWLADDNHIDELRRRSAAGNCHALHSLAGWLADHEQMDELRGLVAGYWEVLSGWMARQGNLRVVRLAAELGDAGAQRHLERWLSRLRDRAGAGDEYVQRFLAENPDWQRFLAGWEG